MAALPRAYGFFAALATPLVLSVHSVVSWDFAMALVPGWHSTIFAPFFVDGAIFSGFAMVLILLIPMRHFFKLHAYITDRHLDSMAKLILVTGLVLTYFYVCEVFTAWYSGEPLRAGLATLKWVGIYAPGVVAPDFCNSVAPLVFFWKRARTHLPTLYVVSILVLIGMWFERFNIIVPGARPRLLPVHLGIYIPTPVDTTIIIGSFAWFFILFLGFIKVMPSLSIVEVKETIPHPVRDGHAPPLMAARRSSACSPTWTRRPGRIQELRAQGIRSTRHLQPGAAPGVRGGADRARAAPEPGPALHAGRRPDRHGQRVRADDLVVAQVGPDRRRQARGLDPAVRGHRLRADHPAGWAVHARRRSWSRPGCRAFGFAPYDPRFTPTGSASR